MKILPAEMEMTFIPVGQRIGNGHNAKEVALREQTNRSYRRATKALEAHAKRWITERELVRLAGCRRETMADLLRRWHVIGAVEKRVVEREYGNGIRIEWRLT